MTTDQLGAILAARVMHWRVTPDRFLTGKRGWLPRWKFQPTRNLKDAFRLLDAAVPQEYAVRTDATGAFWAKVRVGGATGEARESSQARAIAFAIARAIGLNVDASE
jgi:hypothetical protein